MLRGGNSIEAGGAEATQNTESDTQASTHTARHTVTEAVAQADADTRSELPCQCTHDISVCLCVGTGDVSRE